jgi:hypothetical protein
MFKKLVPVIALGLLAGPVVAADAPASTPGADQSSSAPAKTHHKKHHKKATTKPSDSSSTTPAK